MNTSKPKPKTPNPKTQTPYLTPHTSYLKPMYPLTDQQIDFISNDIQSRGIAMVSLQHDLLDHVCCVIERELEPGGDFEQCYLLVIKRFFNTELK